jgi:hypothetical protein
MLRTERGPTVIRLSPRGRVGGWATLATAGLGLACTAAQKAPSLGGTGPAGTAALAVQVGGLPGGTAARVTVTGPAGFARQLSATSQLSTLEAGVYHLLVGSVNAQGQTWTGASSADSVALAAGDSVGVSVTYTGGPLAMVNLSIAGTQLIQSTQRPDNSVPMVANRDALLRVFVVANTSNTAGPAVRVRLFSNGLQVDSVDVPAPSASVPQSVDTASLAASWNVLVPAARVAVGLSYQVEVDPDGSVPETDETDNRWPGAAGKQSVTVQAVPALRVLFVPVKQSVNNLTGSVNAGNKDALIATTQRMFPLSSVTANVRAVYTTSAPALDANDNSGAWAQILNETSALQAADGSTDDYVGIVPTTYSSGIAGLGWIGAPSAIAWDKTGSAPGVIAHELGHNFGRAHAPCGNPSGPDANYPYPTARIGVWGLDLPALSLKSPASYADLMSYCSPDWISDYTYTGVLAFRGAGPGVQPAGPAGPGLLVWGRIRDGAVTLEPSFIVQAPARLPARPGPNQIEGLDLAGNRIFSLAFEGTVVPDLPAGEERQFAFVVPLAAAERDRLTAVRLIGNGMTALRLPFAGLRAGPAPPPARPTARRVGTDLEVRWDPAYPLAIIRDGATGEILAMARDGVGRVPAGNASVTVELSEGVSSTPGVRPAGP